MHGVVDAGVNAGSGVGDVLRLLADCDSTGTLELLGPPRGSFRLTSGRVTGAVTDAVPDLVTRLGPAPERMSVAERRAVARSVLVDAGVALLARPSSVPPRFSSGPAASADDATDVRLEVAELLDEVSGRLARLAEASIGPDDLIAVRRLPGTARVRVDRTCWALLPGLDRPRTPRVLAWLLRASLVDTVLAAASLVDASALEVRPPADRPRSQPPAALPSRRSESRRHATVFRTLATDPPLPAVQPPDREILLRVLAGLRRL